MDSVKPLCAVIIKSSTNKELAKQFIKFIKQPDTVALMAQYGFTLPEALAADNGSMSAPR